MPIGTVINELYEIAEPLGEGGFGTVYRAVHRQLGHSVAIKVFEEGRHEGDGPRELFRREAILGARIRSPHLVDVLDAGELPEGAPYIVMALVQGPSLGELLRRGPLSCSAAIDLGIQACAGLAVLEANGIVHQDIKPHNLVLERDASGLVTVKIIDFGLSGQDGANGSDSGGTPMYMAPEQIRGEARDTRADLFSLGAVLYEALGGRHRLDPSSLPSQMAQALGGEMTPLQTLCPSLPASLVSVIEWTLRVDREDRPPTPLVLSEALRDCALGLELPRGRDAWAAHERSFSSEAQDSGLRTQPRLHTRTDPFSSSVPARRRWAAPLLVAVLVIVALVSVLSLFSNE